MSPKETYFVKKLTEEEIIEYVKGLFDESIGIMQPANVSDRFNMMAWGTWRGLLDTYFVDFSKVGIFFFYTQIGRIKVVRTEDMQEILDRYWKTYKILSETKAEVLEE